MILLGCFLVFLDLNRISLNLNTPAKVVAAQGRADERLSWSRHCIVLYESTTIGEVYFDPSYGLRPFQANGSLSAKQVLNNSLGGFSASFVDGDKLKTQYWYSGSGGLDIKIINE